MPPMPGKGTPTERPAGDESAIYGGGIRGMRANVAKLHGFGPNPDIEPEIERGVRNWITPMSKPNITKSSRDHRNAIYSGSTAAARLAPMLKAAKEGDSK